MCRSHLAAALALALPATLAAQGAERHVLRGDAAIYHLAGTVRVVGGTGSDVVVDVVRRGADGGRIRVATGTVDGRDALRVLFPDDDIVYPALGRRSNVTARVRDDGTFGGRGGAFGGAFGGTRAVRIGGSGRGAEAWADVTVAVPKGRRLAVHLVAGEAQLSNVDGDLLVDAYAASTVAEGTRGRLVVDAGSGSVRVTDAEGDVDLDTGSGAVELTDVRASRLRVDAGSGAVRGVRLGADDANVDTGSGSVRLARIDARNLRLDSGSGSVDVEFTRDVDDVRVDSGSGSVTLRIPASLGASLDIDAGSGGISSDVPLTITRQSRDHLTGTLGDGRGRIVIDGGSGAIRLVRP